MNSTHQLVILSSDFQEAIFVDCRDNDTLTVSVLYRSMNSSKVNSEKLNTIIRNVERHKDKNIFLIGDCNYPDICWELNQSKNFLVSQKKKKKKSFFTEINENIVTKFFCDSKTKPTFKLNVKSKRNK